MKCMIALVVLAASFPITLAWGLSPGQRIWCHKSAESGKSLTWTCVKQDKGWADGADEQASRDACFDLSTALARQGESLDPCADMHGIEVFTETVRRR